MIPPRDAEERDVVVIGGGPGGAVAALELARRGLSVLLLERFQFPRYHIGESLTGTAGDFIRRYELEEEMGARQFPLKTGVKVIGQQARAEFFVPALRPSWQVRRAEFDSLLLERAIATGVEHRTGSVKSVLRDGRTVIGVGYKPEGSQSDQLRHVRARAVVDASGHSAVLSRHRVAGPRRVDAFGRQMATFSQVRGAIRDPGKMGDNTFIFYGERHHWAWFIPLSPDLVSVGVVTPVDTVAGMRLTPDEVFRWGVENINDDLARRMAGAELADEPVRTIRNYSYRMEPFAGPGWFCIGDAHRFADPIFSFGVSFAMTEAHAAADAVAEALETGDFDRPTQRFVHFSNRGQDRAFELIRYFWRFPAFFGFQTRGALRADFVKLLAGDCFGVEDLEATRAMRQSLSIEPPDSIPEGPVREIARQVQDRYQDFQGMEAAHISQRDGGICLCFYLTDNDVDLADVLHDFEESLYVEYGREDLAVLRYPRELYAPPSGPETHPIFDRITQ